MKVDLQLDEWAGINSDLLEEIIQRVEVYGDYVRFRAVCKTWNLELPKIPKYIKFPLLVLSSHDEREIVRQFYHIGEKKVIHCIEIPETKNKFFRGSSYGWLITVRLDGGLQMLEPFTRAQIDLPPLSTFPDIIDYQSDRDEEYTLRHYAEDDETYTSDRFHMQKFHVQKVVLSSPPNDDDQDFMAVAIYGEFSRLAFCMQNDKTWTEIKTPEVKSCFFDVIFHEGKIYAVIDEYRVGCRIFEFDIKTKVGEMSSAPPLNYDCNESHDHYEYLVGTDDGLLLILRHFKTCPIGCYPTCYITCGFNVYKLTRFGWIEVKSLGDYVLVIGFNSSVRILPHTVLHNKGNRIYYSDDNYEPHYYQIGGHDNGVFDLEDGTVHSLIFEKHSIIPAPIWLLPIKKF